MDTTTVLAIYAAALATVTALWTFGKDVVASRQRVRLVFGFDSSVQIGNELVSVGAELRVTNASHSRAVEIISIDLDTFRWDLPSDGGVRPATTEEKVFPVLLSPAKSISIPIYLSSDSFQKFETIRHIMVKDSTGRTHRVHRRQLNEAKALLKDLIRRAGSGPEFHLAVTRFGPDE